MQCAHLKLIERWVKHCWRAYLCNVTGLAKMGELCIDERIENAVYATVLAIMQIHLSFYDRTQTLCFMMILKVFVSRKSRLMKYCMINFVVFKKQRGAVHIRILVRISICSCIGHPCMWSVPPTKNCEKVLKNLRPSSHYCGASLCPKYGFEISVYFALVIRVQIWLASIIKTWWDHWTYYTVWRMPYLHTLYAWTCWYNLTCCSSSISFALLDHLDTVVSEPFFL